MAYEIYIGNYAGTKVLQVPIPPKELPSLSNPISNELFETYWDLPYNFIEKQGLLEFTLESSLPVDCTKYSFVKSKVNAMDIIQIIEDAKTNTEPIKVVINGKAGVYVNDLFSVEKFEYKIMQRQDYSYTLGLKQWRNPNPTVTTTDNKTGWKSDSTGWWYVYDDSGSYYQGCWQLIDNDWYSFQPDGYCKQSAWLNDGNNWYYLGDDCKMYRNKWLQYSDGYWYYLGDDGAMYYGDNYTIDGTNYTFNSDGQLIE